MGRLKKRQISTSTKVPMDGTLVDHRQKKLYLSGTQLGEVNVVCNSFFYYNLALVQQFAFFNNNSTHKVFALVRTSSNK